MQQPGQLEHVVGDAALAGAVGQLSGDHVRGMPVLMVAGAADDVHVVLGDDAPEIHRFITATRACTTRRPGQSWRSAASSRPRSRTRWSSTGTEISPGGSS